MTTSDDWCNVIHTAYSAGRGVALLFDYDGTLAPIVPHPDLAVLTEPARNTLRRLTDTQRLSVGVISGRALADVVGKVRLDGVYYGGSSGAELDLRGVRVEAPLADRVREELRRSCEYLQVICSDLPGVWVEPKPAGFTLHHRGAALAVVFELTARFERIMVEYPALHYLGICEAFEVTPREGWNKGTAVRQILASLPPNVLPVYFGDSLNDEPAMRATREAGGEAIVIGDAAMAFARHRICSPERLHTALAGLLESLACGSPKRTIHSPTKLTDRSKVAARS